MSFFRGFLGFVLLLLLAIPGKPFRQDPTPVLSVAVLQKNLKPLDGRDYVYYTVQPGDSLSLLARKFRIASTASVLEMNPGLNEDRLPLNERIKIPLE